MDVGNISYPQMVDAVNCNILNQVWIDPIAMAAVSGAYPFFLCGTARPAVFPHDSSNFFVVDDNAFTMKLFGHPSVTVLWIL